MKRFTLGLVAPAFLMGCLSPDPEQPIRTAGGKPVYQTRCDVHQGTLGQKALWGPNKGQIITPANACVKIAATCPNGATVLDLTQGVPQYHVERINSGGMNITQRYYTRLTTTTYQCRA